MKKNILTFITILLGSMILLNACKKNSPSSSPTGTIRAFAKDNTGTYTIELRTPKSPFYVGYNLIWVSIKNNTTNQYEQTAGIAIRPYMPQMPEMGVKMPCNNPITDKAENGIFVCGADFTMAGNLPDNPWNLEVKAKLPNVADSIAATCSFDVLNTLYSTNGISTNPSETFANTLTLSGQSYRVDLVNPRGLISGSQSFEMRIFRKKYILPQTDPKNPAKDPNDYWEAVVDNNLKITKLTPYMPDPTMLHDSPKNVDPTLNTSTGAYTGTINFTMTGLWDIQYTLTNGTNTVDGKFTLIL